MKVEARIPKDVRALLDDSGLSWEAVGGGSHIKLKIQGRLAGILPLHKKAIAAKGSERAKLNTITQIKRLVNELSESE